MGHVFNNFSIDSGLDLQPTREMEVTRRQTDRGCGTRAVTSRRQTGVAFAQAWGEAAAAAAGRGFSFVTRTTTSAAGREMDEFVALKTVKNRLSLRAVADATAGI